MKILYLSLRFPYPPHSGDKIRTYNVLKHLSEKHAISFVSFSLSEDDRKNIPVIEKFCERVLTIDFYKFKAYANCVLCSTFSEPFQVAYWRSNAMQKTVDSLLSNDQFDIIHVQFFRMAQYVTKYVEKKKILDSGDSFWLNLSRRSKLDRSLAWPLLRLEASKVRPYEARIARFFDEVTMVSPLDMSYLLKQDSSLPVSVVPMGVDIDHYRPYRKDDYEPILLFTGTIRYFPNKDAVLYFYRDIFPLIKKEIPSVKFYVVGNHPPKSVVDLASNGDVVVTGQVDDVRPYFGRSAVFVCPLRSGSGMQTKILEAMAMGVPVVTTSIGFTAIDAVAGRDIIVADDPRTFAQEVVRLLKDNSLRSSVAQNGRSLVERKYDWRFIVEQFNNIYEKRLN